MTLAKLIKSSIGGRAILISLSTLVATVGSFDVAEAATVNFFDGTFNNSDWALSWERQAGLGVFTVTAEQSLTGGNPDAYRQVNLSAGDGTQVFMYNLSNFVYNPSTQGAIESIGFSYSVLGSGPVGGSFGDGLLLEQNGYLFVGSFTGVNNVGWQTKSVSTVAGYPSLNGGVIDLSASGSPIQFGNLRTTTHRGGFFTSTTGIDNYSVTVTQVPVPVPEPSTILGSGVLGLSAFFKRKLSPTK